MLQLVQNLELLLKQKQFYVLCSIVNIKGSAPQVVGAKMLVTNQGLYWGTVGGGKIEAHTIRYAQDILLRGVKAHSKTWNLQTDIGMSCGGEVTVFFDVNQSLAWQVAIFGAGHIVQELSRIMSTWSCQVLIFDGRGEWLERLPQSLNINKKLSQNLSEEVKNLTKGTFVLSITQGHAADVPVLFAAFKRGADFPFVGVVGSDIKAKKIKAELIEMGVDSTQVKSLVCPIGLPIGNNTPSEIAISIAAQLLAVRDSKHFNISGGFYD